MNSNANGFLENYFEGINNSNSKNLSIKCFSGNPIEYQSFFDSFRAAIHENNSLKNITKFLRGLALASISSLCLTSENYNQAIETLERWYGKKQLLTTSHINQLHSIAPITSTSDNETIREIYDKIEINVPNLQFLDIDTSQYGPVLISIVISKPPEDIKLQILQPMPIICQWDMD